MRGGREAAPPGYASARVGSAAVTARREWLDAVCAAVEAHGTLHDYAARHPEASTLHGRGAAYAAPLPSGGPRVVVRHNRRGGLLAPIRRDRYLAPTRAPQELALALRLAHAQVPTPEILGYVIYPVDPLGILARSDVASLEIAPSRDLAAVLASDDHAWRDAAIDATLELLEHLRAAGARHRDLNLKNVLLAGAAPSDLVAYVLDVDRVEFRRPGDAGAHAANVERLLRSARKWRDERGAPITDEELSRLAGAAPVAR